MSDSVAEHYMAWCEKKDMRIAELEAFVDIRNVKIEQLKAKLAIFEGVNMRPIRTHGFLNKKPDIGRLYVDLPIVEALKYIDSLPPKQEVSDE